MKCLIGRSLRIPQVSRLCFFSQRFGVHPQCPMARISSAQRITSHLHLRQFSTFSDAELNKRLNAFQDLFVEARLCIEDVVDSVDTVYFDDDAEAAKEAVNLAVEEFNGIIEDIEDKDQKNRVLRGNGLKVEQLKGELDMAIKGGH